MKFKSPNPPKKQPFPYIEDYKGYALEIHRDGSCRIKKGPMEPTIAICNDLTEAFNIIDKKENMFQTIEYTGAMTGFCLAPISQQVACPKTDCSVPCSKAKGNNPMYIENDKHIESAKLNYLNDRAMQVYYKLDAPLEKQFGLIDDQKPQTAAEFVKRIQDGKFILKDETKDKTSYDADRYIQWRDPAMKEDRDGYKAAQKSLSDALQDARDTIAIGTPVEGMAAVKTLSAWVPTGAAN